MRTDSKGLARRCLLLELAGLLIARLPHSTWQQHVACLQARGLDPACQMLRGTLMLTSHWLMLLASSSMGPREEVNSSFSPKKQISSSLPVKLMQSQMTSLQRMRCCSKWMRCALWVFIVPPAWLPSLLL